MTKDYYISFDAKTLREKFIRSVLLTRGYATKKAALKKVRQLYPMYKNRMKVFYDPIIRKDKNGNN